MKIQSNENQSLIKRIGKATALTVWLIASFLLTNMIIAPLIIQGVESIGIPLDSLSEALFTVTVAAIVYVLVLLITIGLPWLVARLKTTRAEIGLDRLPSWRDIAVAIAGLTAYIIMTLVALTLAEQFLPWFDASEEQETGFSALFNSYEYILAFVILILVAPFVEEVLFRGYYYGKVRRWLPVWVAVILTSALFGAAHLQWNVAIDVFVLSVVACVSRQISGSLWPAIMIHMGKNSIAFYILFVNPSLIGG